MKKQLLHHLPAFVLFIVLALVGTYPLSLSPASLTTGGGVDQYFTSWMLAWDAYALRHAPLNIFDANIFYPERDSLAFSENLIALAVPLIPLFLAGGEALLANNIVIVASFMLTGFAAYLLAFALARSRAAAMIAGIVFAFYPYRYYHVSHIQLLAAFWIPVCFLLLVRYRREGKGWMLFAAFLCLPLQAMTGAYYAVFLSFGVSLFLLGMIAVSDRRLLLTKQCAIAGFLPALLLLLIHRPYGRVAAVHAAEWPSEEIFGYSADLLTWAAAPPGHWLNSATGHLGAPERYLYPGLIAVLLACAGIRRFNRTVWFFVLLGLAAFTFTCGDWIRVAGHQVLPGPYPLFMRVWPGAEGIRAIPRWSVFCYLALAIAAATGFERLRLRTRAAWIALPLLLVDYKAWPLPVTQPEAICRAAHDYLRAQPDARPLLELPARDWYDELLYQYGSTFHFKPMLTGQSGFFPKGYSLIHDELMRFPDARAVQMLNTYLPTPRVLVHMERMSESERSAVRAAVGVSVEIESELDQHHLILGPLGSLLPAGTTEWRWRGRDICGDLNVAPSHESGVIETEVDGRKISGTKVSIRDGNEVVARQLSDRRYPDRLRVASELGASVIQLDNAKQVVQPGLWCATIGPGAGIAVERAHLGNGTERNMRLFADIIRKNPNAQYIVLGAVPATPTSWKEPVRRFARGLGGAPTSVEPGVGQSYLLVIDRLERRVVGELMASPPLVIDTAPDASTIASFQFTQCLSKRQE